MMRAMRWLAIIVLLSVAARADSQVVIVETRGAPALPALASQIALHASVQIRTQQATDADPLTFADRAATMVAAGEATLVVWLAPVDGGYLVFAAGRAPGRALTELVRVDAAIGVPEMERTIALKIAGLLDAASRPEPVARVLATTLAPVRVHEAWRVEVAGGFAYERAQRGADGRTALLAGRTFTRGRWVLVPALGGYWQPSGTIERTAGRASILELGGIAAVQVEHGLGSFAAFARPRLVAASIAARGVSTDGRRGEAIVFAPYAGLELGLQRVIGNMRAGVLAGCDLALIHRELVIDEQTIVDLGTFRLHVGLALTVAL